jgi:hypothetical protein
MRLHGQALWEEERAPIWFNAVALLISVVAGVTAFLPIALYTSPWDGSGFQAIRVTGGTYLSERRTFWHSR